LPENLVNGGECVKKILSLGIIVDSAHDHYTDLRPKPVISLHNYPQFTFMVYVSNATQTWSISVHSSASWDIYSNQVPNIAIA
jgi:hypothetical protein